MLRKIKTQEEIERKKNRNGVVVGAVLVFLMILSTAGYSLMSRNNNSNEVHDSGIKFVREGGLWKTFVEDKFLWFQFLPSELENISIEGEYDLSDYLNKPLYFTSSNEAVSEIINNLGDGVQRYQEVCVDDECDDETLPIKTCMDNVIIFREGDKNRIYKDENCVYIEGDPVKGADLFLYRTFKV